MKYAVHIQWLPCPDGALRHGIVRLYQNDLGRLVGDLPAKKWLWCCNFLLIPPTAIMYAALTAPPVRSIHLLMNEARKLGVKRLTWERVEEDGVREVHFTV